MPDHGRLFDTFSAHASHSHGGSYFDEGFGHRTLSDAHGKLYDLFGVPREQTAHGERWDDFNWREMPTLHGRHFDEDFKSPSMGDSEHGTTWFDVFRGGRTQARVIVDGRDLEGVVQEVHRDYAVVRSRDGQTHEVGLNQFLAYRTPNDQQASPPIPETESENPSTHDRTAHGAMSHDDRTPVPTELPSPMQHVTPGEHHDADRGGGLPAGLMDTFQTVKQLAEREFGDDDVAKADPGSKHVMPTRCPGCNTKIGPVAPGKGGYSTTCKGCGKSIGPFRYPPVRKSVDDVVKAAGLASVHTGSWHGLSKKIGAFCSAGNCQKARPKGKAMKLEVRSGQHPLHSVPCSHCGGHVMYTHVGGSRPGDSDTQVIKSVDTTATAVQGSPTAGKTVGHRANCPRGGSAPCGADVKGKCSLCGTSVRDHEALGKTESGLGISVPEREHKTSDHHSSFKKPGHCPHCGGALERIDEATSHGQPSRKEKEGGEAEFDTVTCKCMGATLDLLKSLA